MAEALAQARLRGVLALAGARAGLALWALGEVVPRVTENDRVILAFATAAAAFFGPFLAMAGPLPVLRALGGAAALAVPLTLLMTTASLRFDCAEGFVETGHPVVALMLAIAIPVPFLIAGLGRSGQWTEYAQRFGAAWATLVRGVAAGLFLGAFWALVFLSDTLLGLVGITVIEWLLDFDAVPAVLSGLVLGLGAAVAHELADFVSPKLPIRLLQLLLPFALAVTALFLAALPFQGLEWLFGGLSVAATLMGMAFAAATLVTTAIDADDGAAVTSRVMRLSAQALSLMLPVLALLAVYSVTERVSQYGWSPDRLAAITAAVVLAGYGITYAGAVLVQTEWMARIRQANVIVALGVLALGLAWISPFLNAQQLAVTSQVSRYQQGRVSAEGLDLWAIGRQWGRPGVAALQDLEALGTPGREVLLGRLEALADADSRYAFETAAPPEERRALRRAIRVATPVHPAGAVLPDGFFDTMGVSFMQMWRGACARQTPGGAPGCIAVVAELTPVSDGSEIIVFTMQSDRFVQVSAFDGRGVTVGQFGPTWLSGDHTATSDPALIDLVARGAVDTGPAGLTALRLGDMELVILP